MKDRRKIAVLLAGFLTWLGATAQTPEELPLPQIPEEITDRAERISFATDHYWDALDFNDIRRSADEDFMGQNFANFALFLSYQPDSVGVARAAEIFFDKASVNADAFDTARKTARQYLAYQDSPMHNDETWLTFLDVLSGSPSLSEQDRARYEYEHEMALKNRIGRQAADFEYELPDGRITTLLSTPSGSESLYIIFYNPDCESCHEAIAKMRNSDELNASIAEGKTAVLAIDAEEDRDEWKATLGDMPSNWIVGFNTDGLVDRDLYALPAMPTIYLLDSSYRVIGKDLQP